MLIPKLEVLDEIPTNNFFITPQHSPAREIQQLNHHQQQQMFTTTSNNNNYNNYNSAFADVYNQKQPHTTNNNGFSYSQDIVNFTQNNTNYADIMNGLDNNIEKNLHSTATECPSNQIQDIIDKR
ncbi:7711_t:CDS:2 [Entrophospora sp. SA101]|nr:6600_t:CDS:2 [Entrophospora sp. SA101]CAJ0651190.1 7711_t:CDS:2 [Entrophospora sp. SA101]CAJ0833764.1 11436_t:CDS:2 [Entrophospora sp. SA101]CAJ0834801.1 9762_t:CDS:2 [Entrophospora sp. SA101]CAJ0837829.1 1100_t:CDS:2 [Entrophospora sp. SA101]